jgi:hypothetical protein
VFFPHTPAPPKSTITAAHTFLLTPQREASKKSTLAQRFTPLCDGRWIRETLEELSNLEIA